MNYVYPVLPIVSPSWAIMFSHPGDYTPVCTTELARVEQLYKEFNKRAVRMIGLSCDTVESHRSWIKDIMAYSKFSYELLSYPIIADQSRSIAELYGMLDAEAKDKKGIPLTCRYRATANIIKTIPTQGCVYYWARQETEALYSVSCYNW